ncbi:MAG: hypothetical protein IK115_00515 [Lachnospiraceae bacterium]|nr:hypothetical protein [Lachnospiraceae bacterium]
MSGVYECVGRYANTPLTIKNTYVRVWSLEELCYYICENAALVDDSIVTSELFVWLSEELGLKELVKRLKQIRRQSVRLESFIAEILNEAHYVSEEELKTIGRVIRANRSMPETERNMVMGDYYLRGGHYIPALRTYMGLMHDSLDGPDPKQLARILYNTAVIYARLFLFEEAAKYYRASWEQSGSREALIGLLSAKRMQLSDADYMKYLNELPEALEVSGEVEKRMAAIRAAYPEEGNGERIEELRRIRIGSDRAEYEQRAGELLNEEKESYRKAMLE